MPHLELTTQQIIDLVKQLPPEGKRAVIATLQFEGFETDPKTQEWLVSELSQRREREKITQFSDTETQEWLDADLIGQLPPYEWGETEIPQGKPVKYISEQGLVVDGGKQFVQ
ncbi:MAG: hypothetical protein NW224_03785 [Leptolyngbyaceae cyanobacterium bins.302]|nr:hypothetical protein [Leptolyngbyaceae cyanobacterium bins.302]